MSASVELGLLHRVLRASGIVKPLYAHGGDRLVAINYSNYTNNTCKLLIGNENLKDGKIPQVLALAVGVWLVSEHAC